MSEPLHHASRQELDAGDRAIAVALRSVAVPIHLKGQLLALKTTPSAVRHGPWLGKAASWWAVAAVVIAALAFFRSGFRGQSFEQFRERVAARDAANAIAGRPDLDMQDTRLVLLEEYLRGVSAPTISGGFRAPADFVPQGCRTFRWRGLIYSQVCFRDPNGKGIHLFVAKEAVFQDCPGAVPLYARVGGLETASWSKGGTSFVLVAAPGVEMARVLAGVQG